MLLLPYQLGGTANSREFAVLGLEQSSPVGHLLRMHSRIVQCLTSSIICGSIQTSTKVMPDSLVDGLVDVPVSPADFRGHLPDRQACLNIFMVCPTVDWTLG